MPENHPHESAKTPFIEVDKPPVGGGEVLTIRIDGDVQDFYFRQGRTPADTLASSATSQLWYLVEWRDQGRLQFGSQLTSPLATSISSWSYLKGQYGN